MANLLRIRTVVQQTLARQDAERTNQFLHSASSGDVAKIRQVSRTPCPALRKDMPDPFCAMSCRPSGGCTSSGKESLDCDKPPAMANVTCPQGLSPQCSTDVSPE